MSAAADDGAHECVALAWSDFWMLPHLLLHVISELFGRHLVKLKAMRRSPPLAKTWREHLPALRVAEWPTSVVLAEGARQLLAGDTLRLTGIDCSAPPDDFQPALPHSALGVHLSLEQLARFNADPEACVHRHAERIRTRERDSESDEFCLVPNPIPTNPTTTNFRAARWMANSTNFSSQPPSAARLGLLPDVLSQPA